MKINIQELIEISSDEIVDNNKNYIVKSLEKVMIKRNDKNEKNTSFENDNMMKKGREKFNTFIRFLDNVLPTEYDQKNLKGLKFSISFNHEETHYKQMLNIVQILCYKGATYVKKATLSDIFITYEMLDDDGSLKKCSKLKYVKEAIDNGTNIKIITFGEFLQMLDLNEEALNKLPMVSFDCLLREDAIIKDKKINIQKVKELSKVEKITLGDLYSNFFLELRKKVKYRFNIIYFFQYE